MKLTAYCRQCCLLSGLNRASFVSAPYCRHGEDQSCNAESRQEGRKRRDDSRRPRRSTLWGQRDLVVRCLSRRGDGGDRGGGGRSDGGGTELLSPTAVACRLRARVLQ